MAGERFDSREAGRDDRPQPPMGTPAAAGGAHGMETGRNLEDVWPWVVDFVAGKPPPNLIFCGVSLEWECGRQWNAFIRGVGSLGRLHKTNRTWREDLQVAMWSGRHLNNIVCHEIGRRRAAWMQRMLQAEWRDRMEGATEDWR